MILLVVVGLVAGVVTSLSPCVLPVLPAILTAAVPGDRVASVAAGADGSTERRRSWRPYAVVAGLVLSFSVSVLFGTVLLSALHLPQNLLRVLGVAVLVVIGLGLIRPRWGELLERPFARLPGRRVDPGGNGFVLGLGLGLLFVPCAGPVLAAIAVVGAESRAGAVGCAVAFGLAYGLCLVSGLRECERLADRGQHGAVVACFYALTYLGFGVPYLVDALNGVLGRDGTFTALAIVAAASAVWTLLYTARRGARVPAPALRIPSSR